MINLFIHTNILTANCNNSVMNRSFRIRRCNFSSMSQNHSGKGFDGVESIIFGTFKSNGIPVSSNQIVIRKLLLIIFHSWVIDTLSKDQRKITEA